MKTSVIEKDNIKKVVLEKPTSIADFFILFDIETLPFDFTVSVYSAKRKQLIIYSDTHEKIDEAVLTRILYDNFRPLVEHITFIYGQERYVALREWLLYGGEDDHLIRGGWNNRGFDVPVLYCNELGDAETSRMVADDIITNEVRPRQLRHGNGRKIRYKDLEKILNSSYTIDIAKLNEKSGDVDQDTKARTPASLKAVSAYAGLDVLDDEVTRIDFSNWSQEFYDNLNPSLKKLVNPDSSLTSAGLINLLVYNVQDTLNQGFLFEEKEYVGTYHTKKALLDKYKINEDKPLANASDTSARISSLILTGNDKSTYTDDSSVNFDFPMPDGSTLDLLDFCYDKQVIPSVVHDYYETLRGLDMSSYDGKDEWLKEKDRVLSYSSYTEDIETCLTKAQLENENFVASVQEMDVVPRENFYESQAKRDKGKPADPTNATVTVPYYDKDLKPIDSYNTFSVGGAHGATSKNAPQFSFKQARMIKRRVVRHGDKHVVDYVGYIDKKPTDTSAWAIDVGSFYPTFLAKLGVYRLADGSDRYNDIRLERLDLKNSLPENFGDYTEKDLEVDKEQKDAKLILNSVSGASNTMSDYALLPLDNKITSMRVMGNLFIYMVATYYVRYFDARVLSTNTDGIEITFDHLPSDKQPSKKAIFKFSEVLTEKFGFDLEPERLSRFVCKDPNNRIEWHENTINKVSGKLGKGFNPKYFKGTVNTMRLDSKLDHPRAVDSAVLAYIDEHKDYLAPDNKIIEISKTRQQTQPVLDWFEDWLRKFALNGYHDCPFDARDWVLFTKGSRARKYYSNNELLQDNNRHIYVAQNGNYLKHIFKGSEQKITGWTSMYTRIVNTIDDMNNVSPDDLDYEAYAQWAYNTLLVWVDKTQTRPNPKVKEPEPKPTYEELELDLDFHVELNTSVPAFGIA